jgi:hypothetical protein
MRGQHARTPRLSRPRRYLAPNRHPDPLYKSRTPPPPLASLISPLPTHPSCARPFFKLAEASPSPGLLRPNPSPVELDRRPRPCSTLVRHSLATVPAPPEVNFPAGPSFLSPPFTLSHRLVAGDCRYRYRAVEPRPPKRNASTPCLCRPCGVTVSGHGARAVRMTKVDGGPNKEDPSLASPFSPFCVTTWRAPSVSARPRCCACACPLLLISGPDLPVTPPVRPPPFPPPECLSHRPMGPAH